MQVALQEALLGLSHMDAAQRCLGKGVCRDQSQAVEPHLMNAVDCLWRWWVMLQDRTSQG